MTIGFRSEGAEVGFEPVAISNLIDDPAPLWQRRQESGRTCELVKRRSLHVGERSRWHLVAL